MTATPALALAMAPLWAGALCAAQLPTAPTHINSIAMRLVRIEPGSFAMGFGQKPLPDAIARHPWRRTGDFDEHPTHKVTITRPLYMGVAEVTNAQYERFDRSHRKLRGKLGFSRDDDEAVVFVSWHDAARFCRWLSAREGLPYRLPTEAEWEYACRAGTNGPFHTGETLPAPFHKNVRESWFPAPTRSGSRDIVPLHVARTPPNPWGLFDMHGNVEEWCLDWHGPYEPGDQTDPVGRANGDFRVTRGGSHSTELYYLRSSNRSGTIPEDRSWLIGFRVVIAPMPATRPLPPPPTPLHRSSVAQSAPKALKPPDPDKPYFKGPRVYVRIPPNSHGPMFSHHNHDPAVVDCRNGDILAVWYSCVREPGRELAILGSRLRAGAEQWEPAAVFWDAPDRNDHAPALWRDDHGTLYHFNGLSAAATWGSLATILRTSTDNGATWSRARPIRPEHSLRHMPVESVIRLSNGQILLPCDAVPGGSGGTAIHLSDDDGRTWTDTGSRIAGIHAGVVQLKDGRLVAFGRGDNIRGKMPMSISADLGRSWTYRPSPFPPISSGQRLALVRLNEEAVFFASFARAIAVENAAGERMTVSGLFAALSFDEAQTWKVRRAIAPDSPLETETFDGRRIVLGPTRGEPRGYLSVCQTPQGVIHLISSRLHYEFNLKWLLTAPPAPREQ